MLCLEYRVLERPIFLVEWMIAMVLSLNAASKVDMSRMISHVSVFAGVGLPEQHLIIDKCQSLDFDTDEVIIKQGDIGDHLYFILKGAVSVLRTTETGRVIKLATLVSGDVFGEIAILRNIPRTASVITITPCTFLSIDADSFLDIYQYFSPQSRDNIQLVVEKRLMEQRASSQ